MTPSPTSLPPGYLRVPAAAKRVGLSTRMLYERIDDGSLPAARDGEGMVVVPVASLDSMSA